MWSPNRITVPSFDGGMRGTPHHKPGVGNHWQTHLIFTLRHTSYLNSSGELFPSVSYFRQTSSPPHPPGHPAYNKHMLLEEGRETISESLGNTNLESWQFSSEEKAMSPSCSPSKPITEELSHPLIDLWRNRSEDNDNRELWSIRCSIKYPQSSQSPVSCCTSRVRRMCRAAVS